MIGHDYISINVYVFKFSRYRQPPSFDHMSDFIQMHFSFNDFSKKAQAILGAERYKISSWTGVIIAPKTNASPIRSMRFVTHGVNAI